jgi:hypothetical protein
MGDELEGPYKVLITQRVYPAPPKYSIAVQWKRESVLKLYIPDAGNAEQARHICNLLNRDFKANLKEETDDTPDGFDVRGVSYPD